MSVKLSTDLPLAQAVGLLDRVRTMSETGVRVCVCGGQLAVLNSEHSVLAHCKSCHTAVMVTL